MEFAFFQHFIAIGVKGRTGRWRGIDEVLLSIECQQIHGIFHPLATEFSSYLGDTFIL